MKQTKTIHTKKIKILKIIDLFAWFIPLLTILYQLLFQSFWIQSLWDCFEESFVTGLAAVFMFLFITAVLSLPLMLIWKAVSRTLKKSAIKNATFNVLEDFDYFRDTLTDISPTVISMLTDLELEPQKDISALILKFTMMNVVSTDGGSIYVTNINHPDLHPSDRFLLNQIANGGLNPATVSEWKSMAKQEAVNAGYLQKGIKIGGTCASSCAMGCLTPFLIILIAYFITFTPMFQTFNDFLDSIDGSTSDIDIFSRLFATTDMALSNITFLFMTLMIIVAFALPLIAIIYLVVKLASQKQYKRTQEGERLTEEIYGLKNFIHDFSDLSNADKEQLILWDDFLIYAVLLEENTSIVNEICQLKNISVISFNNI